MTHLLSRMKILHVSDLHSNLSWLDWLNRAAAEYDLVCVAGDLLDANRPDTIADQMREVSAVINRISANIAICSGNHDMVHSDSHGPGALWVRDLGRTGVWTDGSFFEKSGRRFYCHPWILPVPAAQEQDIWIIHSPPEGTATSQDACGGFDHGDFDLAELCKSGRGPAIALCGHIHEPRSWHDTLGRSLILNPGVSNDPSLPAHIVVDLEQGTATRHFPGHAPEMIRLHERTAKEVMRNRSARDVDKLLEITVSNQRAEGIHMTPVEIEQARLRLRRLLNER